MKKFIVILLLVLPIFLMITISVAGRIFSKFVYISVESVAFVDELDKEIESIKIGKGEKKHLRVKVLPELANNKKVEYTSLSENVVTVNADGEIEGIDYGFATIVIKAIDNGITNKITINVTNESVESVDIDIDTKEVYLYQSYTIPATVYPSTALDKMIYWTSSDESYVTVDANGKITALKVTEPGKKITITATTRDGEKVDTCEITVIQYLLAFRPQVESGATVYVTSSTTLNLMDIVVYDNTKVTADDIQFRIVGGGAAGSITDKVLTFNTNYEGQPIILKAYIDNGSIQFESQLIVRYMSA